MAKQKNRLTTTRQVLAGERFAYPVPTIHPQKTVGDETRILLTLEPTLNHISRPNRNLARTKLAYPTPPSLRPAREPTSNWTKTNQPTLHRPTHNRTRSCQPYSTESNSTKSNSTTLHRPSGDDTSKKPTTPTSLQKSGEPIGEIEAKDGLPSADRNNKATLLLTGPFRTAKSSAKDLTPLVLKLQYAKYHDALRAPWKNRLLRR